MPRMSRLYDISMAGLGLGKHGIPRICDNGVPVTG
jgi:hypothetical protein